MRIDEPTIFYHVEFNVSSRLIPSALTTLFDEKFGIAHGYETGTVIRSRQLESFHKRNAGLTFELCEKVTVTNNMVEGDVLGSEIKLNGTSKKEVKLDRNSFFRYGK